MKANTHRDDLGEEVACKLAGIAPIRYEVPLKPTLDAMVDKIMQSLSGEARTTAKMDFSINSLPYSGSSSP